MCVVTNVYMWCVVCLVCLVCVVCGIRCLWYVTCDVVCVMRGVCVLQLLSAHPNVVSYRESWAFDHNLWIVMEHMTAGCLTDWVGPSALFLICLLPPYEEPDAPQDTLVIILHC